MQFEEAVPAFHLGSLSYRQTEFAQQGGIKALALHVDRHLVDARQVLALHHAFEVDIAERCYLLADTVGEVFLGTENKHIGLDTGGLQLFHRMLCGLRLQFIGGFKVRDIGKVYADRAVTEFPFHLSDGFKEGCRLDVADGAANLLDDEVDFVVILHNAVFDLVGDVRHHLYGLAEVVAVAFLVDDSLVDLTRGHRVGLCGADACEAFVVTEIKVGLGAVDGHIALAVLVWVQRPRVNIDVRVDFLYGDGVAAGL